MARPKKKDRERREKTIRARVTDAEKNYCIEQADLAGLDETEYVRRRVLGHKIILPPSKADAVLLMELNRIGVNLNQLTKQANAGKDMPYSIHSVITQLQTVLEKVANDC